MKRWLTILLSFAPLLCNMRPLPFRVTHFPGVQHGYDIGFGITLQVFENANYSTNAANKNRLIVFLGGAGETDSTTLKNVGWSKRVGSLGWDGKQYIASTNDTAYYTIISIPTTGQSTDGALVTCLNWFFTNWTNFDTSVHANFNLSGLSLGAGNDVCYRRNCQGSFTAYAKIFQNLVFASVTSQDVSSFSTTMAGVHAKMYEGLADTTNGCCNPTNSIAVYNAFPVSDPLKQLTLIPGAGHDATVWDSMTSPVASTAARNSAIWMADPYVGVDTNMHLLTLNEDMVADGSGGDGGRKGYVMWYHDQNADPFHGINTADVNTGDMRDPDSLYRPYNIRIEEINYQQMMWGKRIYGYQSNTTGHPDTLDFYWTRTPGVTWWNKINSNLRDSTPNLRVIQDGSGSAQWKLLANINDTFQCVIIVYRLAHYSSPFTVTLQSGYSDILFYGLEVPGVAAVTTYNYLSDAQTTAVINSMPKAPMENFLGFNQGNDNLPLSAAALSKHTRFYRPAIYWETRGLYPNDTMVIQPSTDANSFAWWIGQHKSLNSYADPYPTIDGPNGYVEFNQFGTDRGYHQPATDTLWMPRNDYHSYKQRSHLFFSIGAMYGRDTHATDTLLFKADHTKPFATDVFRKIQIGNEKEDFNFPDLALRPSEMVVYAWSLYNGYFGQLGAGMGIKNADTLMQVIYQGFGGWDYRAMLTTTRWAMYAAGARKVPWDVMAGHIYFVKLHEQPNLTLTDRLFGGGVYPGQTGWSDTLTKMRFKYLKWLGSGPGVDSAKKFILDEHAYDATFRTVTTTDSIFSVTSFGVPHIGSYDSLQVQAILYGATMFMLWDKQYQGAVQFQGTNANNAEGTNTFEHCNCWLNYFHNSGPAVIYDSTHFHPCYYFMNSIGARMNGYVPDQEILPYADGQKYIIKGHKPGTDSVCYVVGVMDTLNTGQSFSLNLNLRIGGVSKWVPSFTTITPGDSGQSLSGNLLTGMATPLTQVFFLRELAPPVIGIRRYRWHGLKI